MKARLKKALQRKKKRAMKENLRRACIDVLSMPVISPRIDTFNRDLDHLESMVALRWIEGNKEAYTPKHMKRR